MSQEIQYTYPVEELDKIIEQMNSGITPMMSKQMELEVQLRYKQINDEIDDDDVTSITEHNARVKQAIEKKRREASRHDVAVINLTDKQRAELEEQMSVSIVRNNPNSPYNLPDDVLYESAERKIVQQKLSRIRNCYYNQTDYVNAIRIISDAIRYSLQHDYPWMTYEEAVKEFNEGKIKFKYCRIPKLYINHSTMITDPDILKGIITGEVTLKDRSEAPKTHDKTHSYTPVSFDYDITGKEQFDIYARMHAAGYDTPISPILKTKSTIYNRFALPSTNRFASSVNQSGEPVLFDWTREGAGEEYFNMIHGKKVTVGEIIRSVNADNDGMLSNVVSTNATEFLNSMKMINGQSNNGGYSRPDMLSTSLTVNPNAAKVEQDILAAIRANNPSK